MYPFASATMTHLNHEWDRLRTRRPASPTGLPWSRVSPALDAPQVGELLDTLLSRPAPQIADGLLWPLLLLASEGDELAARTILQATMGMAVRLSHQARHRGLEDPEEVALSALWSAIRTYPLHRRKRVAANLHGQALKALPHLGEVPCPTPVPIDANEAIPPCEHPATEEGAALLVWARTHQILREEDLLLMEQVYLREVPTGDVAAAQGLSQAAVRQRLSRATRALARAVQERLGAPSAGEVVEQVRFELSGH